jgi:ketosteroid isomerase-like protein
MSQENVEVVRRAWESDPLGRDDDAFLDAFSFDVVVQQTGTIPDARTNHGHDGLMKVISEWTQVFDGLVMAPKEFTDIGDDKVLVRVHQEAQGAGSGVPVEFDTWFVYSVRDGKIGRLEMFNEKHQALKAAGLSE